MDLHNFDSQGFFQRPKEEQEEYLQSIYDVSKDILSELERDYPNGSAKLHYILNMVELKKELIYKEDYEMTYLINETIERLQNEREENG